MAQTKPIPPPASKSLGSSIDNAESTPAPASEVSSPTKPPLGNQSAHVGQASSPAKPLPINQAGIAGRNGAEATPGSRDQDSDASANGQGAITYSGAHNLHAPYAFLALAAETLEDIERARIASENRARALIHPEQNIGLPPDDPHVALAEGIADEMLGVEKRAEKALKRMLRDTPLWGWVNETAGVGPKQAARLLGVIGDPRIRIDGETGEVLERTVGQLWSYCGYAVEGGVAPRRRRGEQGNWNPKARMRAYLISESCMKTPTSPYRKLYEDGRAKYADSVHEHPCPQCGAKGKPAEPGSELRDGHKHARALRLVAKEVLKDLWLAAGHEARD